MSRLRTPLAVVVLLLPLSLLAAPVAAPTAFDKFMGLATGAGKTTVTLGSDGTPLAAPGVPQVSTDGGLPKVETSGSLRNPAGNPVPVTATGRIPAAEVAKAVGRAAVKVVGVLAVGAALYDLAKELGFLLDNSSGSLVVSKVDSYAFDSESNQRQVSVRVSPCQK